MNKVLVVAYIFPPLGGSGVQRTLKFVKFLPNFDWQPYVVCGSDPYLIAEGLDPSLLGEIPHGVKVWRRPFVNPMGIRRWIYQLLRMEPRDALVLKTDSVIVNSQNSISKIAKPSLLRRIFQVLVKLLSPIETPPIDAAIYWALAIVPGCMRLIRREKINLIYSSSFPYSDHVAAWILKSITGLPWVADFRDPWSQDVVHQNKGWRRFVDLKIEQRILNKADYVINLTPTSTKNAQQLAPNKNSDAFITIENGFDSQDFLKTHKEKKDGKIIHLVHVGRLYDGTALPLFEAFEQLGGAAKSINLKFIGGLCDEISNWLKDHSVAASIEVQPRIPHKQAIEVMRSADILLLFIGLDKAWGGLYRGKMFEYMASNVPVLLIGTQGDSSNLLEQSGTGCFIEAGDIERLTQILMLIAENQEEFRKKYFIPNFDVINSYERQALTRKLAVVFNKLTIKNSNK